MQGLYRAGFELRQRMQIELARLLALRVYQQPAAPDLGAQFGSTCDHVCEQCVPQPAPLMPGVHAQARQQREGLSIPTDAARGSRGQVTKGDTRHGPRVVRDDLSRTWLSDNRDVSRARGVRLACVLTKPLSLLR